MSQRQVITVYEDRQTKLKLSEGQVRDLLALKDILGSQNLVLQADGTFRLQRYVGFIVKNQISLQVLPKIFQEDNPAKNSQMETECSTDLLFRLLAYSDFINVKELPEPQEVLKFNYDLLEIFISLFARRFLQLFGVDPHRQYQARNENMQFIKGKILFQESLRYNSFKKHLHYVVYDEYALDNPLNQIFKAILLQLIRATKSAENKANIKNALNMLEEVQTVVLNPTVMNAITFNRLNKRYEPLYNLAKLFYHNYQPGFKEGDANTFSFLVPLNKLFEKVVLTIVEKSVEGLASGQFEVRYQKPAKHLARSSSGPVFQLQPDITILNKDKVEVILDAKYKNPISNGKVSVNEADLYQMLAYAVAYKCRNIYLIYPVFKTSWGISSREKFFLDEFFIEQEGVKIRIALLQLDITQPDFSGLVESMQDELRGCLSKL